MSEAKTFEERLEALFEESKDIDHCVASHLEEALFHLANSNGHPWKNQSRAMIAELVEQRDGLVEQLSRMVRR